MDTEGSPVLSAEQRMIAREAGRWWWLLLVSGVVWLVIAWLVLRANVTSLTTVGILIGIVLVMAAVNEAAMASAVMGVWKALHYGIAVLLVLAAVWAFVRPVNTFFALASVLGLILLLQGAFEIIRGVASRGENPFWWSGLLTGGLLILLAFWVSASDREFNLARRAYLILFWVGLMAVFRGFSQIMLAFAVRRAAAVIERGELLAGDSAETAAIPPQDRRSARPETTAESAPSP